MILKILLIKNYIANIYKKIDISKLFLKKIAKNSLFFKNHTIYI